MSWKIVVEGLVVVAALAALQAGGDYVAHLTGLPTFVTQLAAGALVAAERWVRTSPWAVESGQNNVAK